MKTTAEPVEFMMVTLKIKEQTEFAKYINPLNHATSVLHPELGNKSSIIKKDKKRIKHNLRRIDASAILDDISLDL